MCSGITRDPLYSGGYGVPPQTMPYPCSGASPLDQDFGSLDCVTEKNGLNAALRRKFRPKCILKFSSIMGSNSNSNLHLHNVSTNVCNIIIR